MFTGLVEATGRVADIKATDTDARLIIEAPDQLSSDGGASIGDSVSINGCCLTVVAIDGPNWAFEAGRETLSRTNLGDLKVDHRVNLERSLPVNGRMGGHFVQGHVDCVGTVDAIDREGEWIDMWFRVPADYLREMVEKGSIAIDGVSLTLVNVDDKRLSVALIPHTLDVTTLGDRAVGDLVNIETDILGKYVQKLLRGGR